MVTIPSGSAPSGSARALLDGLSELLGTRKPNQVLRVAVDGPDTAGKTTLADALAARLSGRRAAIRVSIDSFHRPREQRYRRGPLSPEGYYEDSFDHEAIRRWVLEPLGPAGDRRYWPALFDFRADTPRQEPPRLAPADAVLLFDGVFLLRPELREHWDLRIFVDVAPEEALRRALVRDAELMGGADAVRERYRHRYLPGQQLYRQRCSPAAHADIVIDNTDPEHPAVRSAVAG